MQLHELPSKRVQIVASQTTLVNVHIHLMLKITCAQIDLSSNGYSYYIGDPAISNCKWHVVSEQIATQTT